mmetsp:Transcript_75151/g.199595  ORF Transcript_75151/g.199595 Transcript_75151/m.199595 type:complete len:206 (+) Transcript_75151:105-722(+)
MRSSTVVLVEVSSDLVLDAAMVGQLHDGAGAAARAWPSDHARVVEVTAGHRLAEDPRETAEVRRLAMAGKSTRVPAGLSADERLSPLLEAGTVAVVVHEVDVELVDGPVMHRVGDERTARTAAARMRCVHPLVVVADGAAVDGFHAGPSAPHLVTTLGPTMPLEVIRHACICQAQRPIIRLLLPRSTELQGAKTAVRIGEAFIVR